MGTVNKICDADHRFGKLNGKIAEICDKKAEENQIEKVYEIQEITNCNDCFEEKKCLDPEHETAVLTGDAKFVQLQIKQRINERGQIGKDNLQEIMRSINS